MTEVENSKAFRETSPGRDGDASLPRTKRGKIPFLSLYFHGRERQRPHNRAKDTMLPAYGERSRSDRFETERNDTDIFLGID